MPESIFDLFQQVRSHPDFVFGTIFVDDDVPEAKLATLKAAPKWAEECITAAGFEFIANAEGA